MNVPVDHPDLTTKELPAGLDVAAVVTRKKSLIAAGSMPAAAETNAIQIEQVQAERDAHHHGPEGVKEGQNRRPLEHCPARPADAASGEATQR